MTIEEIQTALAELTSEMLERGIPRPQAQATINGMGQRHYIYLSAKYGWRGFEGSNSKVFFSDTISGCFDVARDFIASMPSPEEAVTREYLTRVASAIDYATENSIADEYVTPLRGVTCAMTENLLTKEQDT